MRFDFKQIYLLLDLGSNSVNLYRKSLKHWEKGTYYLRYLFFVSSLQCDFWSSEFLSKKLEIINLEKKIDIFIFRMQRNVTMRFDFKRIYLLLDLGSKWTRWICIEKVWSIEKKERIIYDIYFLFLRYNATSDQANLSPLFFWILDPRKFGEFLSKLSRKRRNRRYLFFRFFVSVRREGTLHCDFWSSEFISFWILDPNELGEFLTKKFEVFEAYLFFVTRFFVTMRFLTKQIYLLFSLGSWIQVNSINFYRNH